MSPDNDSISVSPPLHSPSPPQVSEDDRSSPSSSPEPAAVIGTNSRSSPSPANGKSPCYDVDAVLLSIESTDEDYDYNAESGEKSNSELDYSNDPWHLIRRARLAEAAADAAEDRADDLLKRALKAEKMVQVLKKKLAASSAPRSRFSRRRCSRCRSRSRSPTAAKSFGEGRYPGRVRAKPKRYF